MDQTALQSVTPSRNGSAKPKKARRSRSGIPLTPAAEASGASGTTQLAEGRKIAILGKAPSSIGQAPFNDPDWEIWILNTSGYNKEVPRWDRQFELHPIEWTKAPGYGGYYQWLREQKKPVYVREATPDIPSHVVYPRKEVQERFGQNLYRPEGPMGSLDYFTNSISWMIALALYEGCGEIGLYGIDMAQHAVGVKSEYAHQRPSCELFIGIALGMGVKVTIPATSDMLKTAHLYAFDVPNAYFQKLNAREKELKARIAGLEQAAENAQKEALYLSGALEDINWQRQWFHPSEIPQPQQGQS